MELQPNEKLIQNLWSIIKHGLKYRILQIYQYFDFTDISKISVDIFSQISMSENYLKLIGMLEKTSKNDKISKNTHFKVIL